MVSSLKDRITPRHQRLPVTHAAQDQTPLREINLQDGTPHCGRVFGQDHLGYLYTSVGEALHVYGAGRQEGGFDLLRRHFFGVDHEVYAEYVLHEGVLRIIVRIVYPGNGTLHAVVLGRQDTR